MAAQQPLESPPPSEPAIEPIASFTDPRTISLMTTEHWSLLSARSLAYNEAFVRAGMFLTFLSMSFIALGLLAQASGFTGDFLVVAALILSFDLVIGLTTYVRMLGANFDDYRAMHGMARLRHGYTQMSPYVGRYFTTATYDDADSVELAYGPIQTGPLGDLVYGLSTSAGMVGLIVSMVGGVLASVLGMIAGIGGGVVLVIGLVVFVVVFVVLVLATMAGASRWQHLLEARFPAPAAPTAESTPAE